MNLKKEKNKTDKEIFYIQWNTNKQNAKTSKN